MQISEKLYDKLLKTLSLAYLRDLQLTDELSSEGLRSLITLQTDGHDNIRSALDELIEAHIICERVDNIAKEVIINLDHFKGERKMNKEIEETPKTVWHKVANGDLPNKPDCYYCYYAGNSHSGYHVMFWDGENFPAEYASKVVAWMALPKYEGEEK